MNKNRHRRWDYQARIPVGVDSTDHLAFFCPECSDQSMDVRKAEYQPGKHEVSACTLIWTRCPVCKTNGMRRIYHKAYGSKGTMEVVDGGSNGGSTQQRRQAKGQPMCEAQIEETKEAVQQAIDRRKATVNHRFDESISNAVGIFYDAHACDDPYAFIKAIESLPVEVLIEIVHRKTFRIMADDKWEGVCQEGLWQHLIDLESAPGIREGESDD